MEITYPEKVADVAELRIDGNLVRYRIPPKIGTHQKVFQALLADEQLRTAQGREIVAYAHGCLVYRKNEWADQNRVKFPTDNYLRFPIVQTIVPITSEKKFGDLEGGMFVDSDLKGEGIEMKTEVPADLSGFAVSEGGVYVKDKRLFVPYDSWYKEQWDEKNGVVIALSGGIEGAEMLMKTSVDSKRNYRPLWKVDPKNISSPEKRVPVLLGSGSDGLYLDCDYRGYGRGGCGAGVLK